MIETSTLLLPHFSASIIIKTCVCEEFLMCCNSHDITNSYSGQKRPTPCNLRKHMPIDKTQANISVRFHLGYFHGYLHGCTVFARVVELTKTFSDKLQCVEYVLTLILDPLFMQRLPFKKWIIGVLIIILSGVIDTSESLNMPGPTMCYHPAWISI